MINIIELPLPEVNTREVERYLGIKASTSEVSALIARAQELIAPYIKTTAVYRTFDISIDGDECDLGFARVRSHSLARNLLGCSAVILVCATVGLEIDRLIKRYEVISPSLSHAISALGSERVEALMDSFCCLASERFGKIKPRFSAGYGDFELVHQRDIFTALEPHRTIGVTLTDSLLMSPSKSVSAIIGICRDIEEE